MKAVAVIALIALLLVVLGFLPKKSSYKKIGALPEPSPHVHDLIQQGKVVEAIKSYREETSVSLMDAKTLIERYAKDIN